MEMEILGLNLDLLSLGFLIMILLWLVIFIVEGINLIRMSSEKKNGRISRLFSSRSSRAVLLPL